LTHGIVHVVLYDEEPTQELAGLIPVPTRRSEKGGVERLGRFGRAWVGRDGC